MYKLDQFNQLLFIVLTFKLCYFCRSLFTKHCRGSLSMLEWNFIQKSHDATLLSNVQTWSIQLLFVVHFSVLTCYIFVAFHLLRIAIHTLSSLRMLFKPKQDLCSQEVRSSSGCFYLFSNNKRSSEILFEISWLCDNYWQRHRWLFTKTALQCFYTKYVYMAVSYIANTACSKHFIPIKHGVFNNAGQEKSN
jgi:hypothetical protein